MSWRDNYIHKTVILTVSLPMDMLMKVEEFRVKHGWSRSYSIGYLVHMGLVYCRLLEEKYQLDEKTKK